MTCLPSGRSRQFADLLFASGAWLLPWLDSTPGRWCVGDRRELSGVLQIAFLTNGMLIVQGSKPAPDMTDVPIAAAAAGVALSFILGPTELLKVGPSSQLHKVAASACLDGC
jgi:hypothetical protein